MFDFECILRIHLRGPLLTPMPKNLIKCSDSETFSVGRIVGTINEIMGTSFKETLLSVLLKLNYYILLLPWKQQVIISLPHLANTFLQQEDGTT